MLYPKEACFCSEFDLFLGKKMGDRRSRRRRKGGSDGVGAAS